MIKNQTPSLIKVNYWFILTLIINLLAPLTNVAFAWSLKYLIDDGVQQRLQPLYRHLLICLGIVVGFVIMHYLAQYLSNIYADKQLQICQVQLMRRILHLDYVQFNHQATTDYQQLLLKETQQLGTDYLQGFFKITRNGVLIIYALLGMFCSEFWLATLVLLTTAIPLVLSGKIAQRSEPQKTRVLEQEKIYSQKIREILSGYLTIKTYQVEAQLLKIYHRSLQKYGHENCKFNNQEAATATISEFSGLLVFLVAFGGGMLLTAQGYTTVGNVTAIVQLVNYVVLPINELGLLLTRFQSARTILQQPLWQQLTESETPTTGVKGTFHQELELQQVTFTYPKALTPTLKNLTVRFIQGHKYAITGPSGSGKTTLIQLLLRLRLPDKGIIRVDQTSLQALDLTWWYAQLAVVQQNVFIFNTSLLNNVTLGRPYTDAQVHTALLQAGLGDFLQKINNDLTYPCGENGHNLSGGQKQRISLARALFQAKPLILLDEATSALDAVTAQDVETKILQNPAVTVIAITHQTSLSPLYDQVLQLTDGHLVSLRSHKGTSNKPERN